MTSSGHEATLRAIMGEVTEKLTADLRDVLSKTLEHQLTEALTQALLESEVYRRISTDMRSGLQRIYKEISSTAAMPDQNARAEQTNRLFHEASEQLSTVLSQTEQATVAILEVVEKLMDLQAESQALIKSARTGEAGPADLERLEQINGTLGEDLSSIMLSLSFQDLTGQRIKRAVAALKEIESTVVELYLSTGLLLQAYEEAPDKPLDQIEAETRKQVSDFKGASILDSELKGPTESSQKNIDDLLSQLGM